MRAGGGPPVLSVDPDPGELAIVAIEARQNPHMPDTVTLSLLDRPGGQPVAVVYGTPEGLKAMAEWCWGRWACSRWRRRARSITWPGSASPAGTERPPGPGSR